MKNFHEKSIYLSKNNGKIKAIPKCSAGFTLLELLLVIAILSIVTMVFIRPFSQFQKEQILHKETDGVVSVLEEARSKTLASINNTFYGVHFATTSVVLFQGAVFSSETVGNETHSFDALVTMNAPMLQGGGSDVVFKKRTGETDFYGTITLQIAGSLSSSTISILRTGLIEVI